MRRFSLLLVLSVFLLPLPAAADQVTTQAVWFRVVNPLSPLFVRTVRGTMYTPQSAPGCSRSVVLMLHGLSYGAFAWDFPLAAADPAIVAEDTRRANLTPSGELLTIGEQPSRLALPLISAPVLLLLAENDALFPPTVLGVDYAALELALFTLSFDKTAHVVPDAGHSFMLHASAPQSQQVVADWLGPRLDRCAVP